MKELVEFIARSLAGSPDQVSVRELETGGRSTILELRVAPDDLGRVIGRQGRTARAIRSLLTAASEKSGHNYTLDIVE
jgi:uncharacterized protein